MLHTWRWISAKRKIRRMLRRNKKKIKKGAVIGCSMVVVGISVCVASNLVKSNKIAVEQTALQDNTVFDEDFSNPEVVSVEAPVIGQPITSAAEEMATDTIKTVDEVSEVSEESVSDTEEAVLDTEESVPDTDKIVSDIDETVSTKETEKTEKTETKPVVEYESVSEQDWYYVPTDEERVFSYKLAYAEAGSEDPMTQTMCINTGINRAKKAGISLIEVYTADGQFTPVRDGVPTYWDSKKQKRLPVTEDMLSDELKAAVDEAFKKDYTADLLKAEAERLGLGDEYWEGGALYFCNMSKLNKKQSDARANIKCKVKHGKVTYYRVWDMSQSEGVSFYSLALSFYMIGKLYFSII